MKSIARFLTFVLLALSSVLAAQVPAESSALNLQVQVIKEDASLYMGQPFWIGFQIRVPPRTKLGWHIPLGSRAPTQFRVRLPKPLIVTQWIWPMPTVVWQENGVDVFYQNSFTVLAQVQWSGAVSSHNRFNSSVELAQWFLQAQANWGQLIDKVDLTGDFTLPSIRLSNEVPLAQDPLVLSEFARVFYSMPQRLDPALVDWRIAGENVQMIIRQPISSSARWAVIPTHSRVEIPKSASLSVAVAKQQTVGKDMMLVFDKSLRKQWAMLGIDEVMIIDEKNQQALIVSLELEFAPALTWIEKISQWWNLQVKTGIKSALRV